DDGQIVALGLFIDVSARGEGLNQIVIHSSRQWFFQLRELCRRRNRGLTIPTYKAETFERGSGETGHELRLLPDEAIRRGEGAPGVLHFLAYKHELFHPLIDSGITFFRTQDGAIHST